MHELTESPCPLPVDLTHDNVLYIASLQWPIIAHRSADPNYRQQSRSQFFDPTRVLNIRCDLGSAVARADATVLVREDGFEYDGQPLSLPNLSGVGRVDLLLRYHPAVRCTVAIVYVA